MKKMISIFMIVIMSFSIASCAPSGSSDAIPSVPPEEVSAPITDKTTLTIYAVDMPDVDYDTKHSDSFYTYINTAAFNEKYPDVKVNIKWIAEADYQTTLAMDLMTGGGPDIIVLDTRYTSLYPDGRTDNITKLLNSGILCNLDPFIEADKEFNMADYDKTVMDAGLYKGARLFFPYEYNTTRGPLLSTDQKLAAQNITLDAEKGYGFEAFKTQITSAIDKRKAENKAFVGYCTDFSQLYDSLNIDCIDYVKKTVKLNTKEFKSALAFYKVLYNDKNTINTTNIYEALKNDYISAFPSISYYRATINAITDMEALKQGNFRELLYPPYEKEKGFTGYIYLALAINNNSKNKHAAYEYIKSMITQTYVHRLENFSPYNPTREKEFTTMNSKILAREGSTWENTDYVSDEALRHIKALLANTKRYIFPDITIQSFMDETAKKYAEDKVSLEQAVIEMQNKISIYLNE